MKPQFYNVEGPWPGCLAIVARPRGRDWLADELRGLREAGFDHVVSLLETSEADDLGLALEAVEADRLGLQFSNLPVPDRGVPHNPDRFLAALQGIREQLQGGSSVAVHCRQSVGRAGLLAVLLLMLEGIRADEAISSVSSARRLQVPETAEQADWLRRCGAQMFAHRQ